VKIPVSLTVNGDKYFIDVEPEISLLELLRERLRLTGTKCGCNKGDCGACTVILNGKSVNSCLVLAAECDGSQVITIEGLSLEGKLHPVQEAFIEEGAVQCGFCTPGMIMQIVAFLDHNPNPDVEEARAAIEGNICRCTGYGRIVRAILTAAQKIKEKGNSCESTVPIYR
jgi:carbon-monoxide dehydrogenase small subunit